MNGELFVLKRYIYRPLQYYVAQSWGSACWANLDSPCLKVIIQIANSHIQLSHTEKIWRFIGALYRFIHYLLTWSYGAIKWHCSQMNQNDYYVNITLINLTGSHYEDESQSLTARINLTEALLPKPFFYKICNINYIIHETTVIYVTHFT